MKKTYDEKKCFYEKILQERYPRPKRPPGKSPPKRKFTQCKYLWNKNLPAKILLANNSPSKKSPYPKYFSFRFRGFLCYFKIFLYVILKILLYSDLIFSLIGFN